MRVFSKLVGLSRQKQQASKFAIYTSCTYLVWYIYLITGAQPKAGTGHKMQTVRFFNVTLLGIYR